MISFTPDELKLLAADSVACDLCGHDGDTRLLPGDIRSCVDVVECIGRVQERRDNQWKETSAVSFGRDDMPNWPKDDDND